MPQQGQRVRLSALIMCASSYAVPWHPWDAPWLAVASGEIGLHCCFCTSEDAAFGWMRDFLQREVFFQCCWCWLQGGNGYSQAHSPVISTCQRAQGILVPDLSASWPQPTPAHSCSGSSMEHGWVNTSVLRCDSGCSVPGAKIAVPSHPDMSLAGLALQGSPWVLGSTYSQGMQEPLLLQQSKRLPQNHSTQGRVSATIAKESLLHPMGE